MRLKDSIIHLYHLPYIYIYNVNFIVFLQICRIIKICIDLFILYIPKYIKQKDLLHLFKYTEFVPF